MNSEEIALGELATMKYGKMPERDILVDSCEGFPVYSGYRITGYAKEFLYQDPMLIVVARGVGGTGDVKISPPQSWITNLSIVLSVNDNVVDKKYLCYKLNKEKLKEKLNTGAAQAQITIENLSSYKIELPPIHIQKRISNILSAYDALIENNRRRIQLLEQAARLLYREWFVNLRFPGHEHVKIEDGVPEGWEKKMLWDIIEIKKGKNITKETASEGKIPVVAGGLTPAYFHKTPNATGPVITISASGANAGYVNIYHEDIWASDCSYISKESTEHIYYYYTLLKSKQMEIIVLQKGAAQPHVYPKDLLGLAVISPPDKVIRSFEETISNEFILIKNLIKQNKSLAQARDLLLPHLMNGEVSA